MIKRAPYLLIALFSLQAVMAQAPEPAIISALKKDAVLENASVAYCALDAQTGKPLDQYNANLSLTPASTLKIFTTACALQILGKDFTYETALQYTGSFNRENGTLDGNLVIKGSGDPSLNSEYFRKKEDTFALVNKWADVLAAKGIKKITGDMVLDVSCFDEEIPANWIWADMGNYYGAAANGISYNDNKFYIYFKTGKKNGDSTLITRISPYQPDCHIDNYVKTGGHGDNAVIYHAPGNPAMEIRGTLPAAEQEQNIEGSLADAAQLLGNHLAMALAAKGIAFKGRVLQSGYENKTDYGAVKGTLYIHTSPTLEKLVHLTNLHSNNLFAESIFHTLSYKKYGYGSNDKSIALISAYLKSKGLDSNGLFFTDGCGLSRSNAVTARHLCMLLHMMYNDSVNKEAFIKSLPVSGLSGSLRSFGKGTPLEKNLKAKSGYITRARSYAGYMKAKSGKELCVSVLINNYNGSPTEAKKKMEEIILAVYNNN